MSNNSILIVKKSNNSAKIKLPWYHLLYLQSLSQEVIIEMSLMWVPPTEGSKIPLGTSYLTPLRFEYSWAALCFCKSLPLHSDFLFPSILYHSSFIDFSVSGHQRQNSLFYHLDEKVVENGYWLHFISETASEFRTKVNISLFKSSCLGWTMNSIFI